MNAKEGLRMCMVAIDGLAFIEGMIGLGKPVEATLAAIAAALRSIRGGVDGNVSSQVVLLQLDKLRDQLAENDAKADSDLDKRFPT